MTLSSQNRILPSSYGKLELGLLFAGFILLNTSWAAGDDDVKKDIQLSYGEMTVFPNNGTNQSGPALCFQFPSDYFDLPTTSQAFTTRYRVQNETTINPCDKNTSVSDNVEPDSEATRLVLMKKDENCSLREYLQYTKDQNATGLLIVGAPTDHLNLTTDSLQNLTVVAFVISTIEEDISKAESLYVELKALSDDAPIEGASIVLIVLACFCVAVGSVTANLARQRPTHQQIAEGETQPPFHDIHEMQLNFSITLVVCMVVFISTVLVLLYFFYMYLVYFFVFVYCVATSRALFDISVQILNICDMDLKMPKIRGWGIHRYLLLVGCVAAPCLWFVFRKTPHIWILEDVLGVCFCIHLLQTIRLPSLKICTVLLSMLFVYDVFFVFVTPLFTADGKSIMVEVATGAGSGETLPLLLRIPHFKQESACYKTAFSLLGFGDVILPGLLVCFSLTYDNLRKDKYPVYFIIAMSGYVIGLIGAFIALHLMRVGQPALLYIVPAIVIPLTIGSLIRKDFKGIWTGEYRPL